MTKVWQYHVCELLPTQGVRLIAGEVFTCQDAARERSEALTQASRNEEGALTAVYCITMREAEEGAIMGLHPEHPEAQFAQLIADRRAEEVSTPTTPSIPRVSDLLRRFPTEGASCIFDQGEGHAPYIVTLEKFRAMLANGEGDDHAAIVMPATTGEGCRTWHVFEYNDTGLLSGMVSFSVHYRRHTILTRPFDGGMEEGETAEEAWARDEEFYNSLGY